MGLPKKRVTEADRFVGAYNSAHALCLLLYKVGIKRAADNYISGLPVIHMIKRVTSIKVTGP